MAQTKKSNQNQNKASQKRKPDTPTAKTNEKVREAERLVREAKKEAAEPSVVHAVGRDWKFRPWSEMPAMRSATVMDRLKVKDETTGLTFYEQHPYSFMKDFAYILAFMAVNPEDAADISVLAVEDFNDLLEASVGAGVVPAGE